MNKFHRNVVSHAPVIHVRHPIQSGRGTCRERHMAVTAVRKAIVVDITFCFEHILLIYSKGLGTSSGNLLVPLPKLFQYVIQYIKQFHVNISHKMRGM
jgi:hypothetical protein